LLHLVAEALHQSLVERLVGDAVADQGLEVHVLAVAVVQRGHGLVGDEQEIVLVVAVGAG